MAHGDLIIKLPKSGKTIVTKFKVDLSRVPGPTLKAPKTQRSRLEGRRQARRKPQE